MPSISQNRKFLMGLSILSIMFCHNSIVFGRFQDTWAILQRIAQCGVDVFLLLSGFGLYFSYSKKPNYSSFLQKRLSVILPPFFIVVIPYIIIISLLGITDLKYAIWNYSLISFFLGGKLHAWYIAAILALYLLFPLLFHVAKKHALCIMAFLALLATTLLINFVSDVESIRIVNEIFIVRIPVFIAGIKLAQIEESGKGKRPSVKVHAILFLLSVLAVVGLSLIWRWNYWTYLRLLFFPMSISACYTFSFLRSKLHGKLDSLICYLGGITLWLYLIHENILQLLQLAFDKLLPNRFSGRLLANGMAVLLAIVMGALFSEMLKMIRAKLKRTARDSVTPISKETSSFR